MRGKSYWCFLALAFIWVSSLAALVPGRVEDAVVKVIVVTAPPNYQVPWQNSGQRPQGGSGVVIEGGLILTNAHVVAYQTFIQVQRQGDPTKFQARVVAVGHECDLALLKVEDENFLKAVRAVSLGEMPKVRDKVAAYGYPIGGDKLSITEGVVSRVEMGEYSHCFKKLPQIQIDAAINPGNSGGPVIDNGKIVGIAFQGLGGAENVGYMIPPPVIRHFLDDVKDGKYDGFPTLGVQTQGLENGQHRKSLGMAAGHSGVLVTRVAYNSSGWGVFQEGDVILATEGQEVGNDGTVPFGTERIDYDYFLVFKHPGDKARVKVLREGKQLDLVVPLRVPDDMVESCDYDVSPTYYVFGGLVFTPLTYKYFMSSRGRSPLLVPYLVSNLATEAKREVVVLQFVLADEVNVGYHDIMGEVVTSVNGSPVRDLADMIAKIEATSGEFVRIETDDATVIVLSLEDGRAANPRILERYQVPADRSADLRK